jgi:Tol biopolymer transport system component
MKTEIQRYHEDSTSWIPYEFAPDPSAGCPDFSRDGKWVTYVKFPEGRLYISRIDGSQKFSLTESEPRYPGYPRFSPDGTKIAFLGGQNPWRVDYRAYVVAAGGGEPLARAVAQDYPQNSVAWSPEGELLVGGDPKVRQPLRKVNLQTGDVQELPDSTGISGCAWSPDGQLIACQGPGHIVLFDVETEEWMPLEGCRGWMLSFSNDGRKLFFLNRQTLFQCDLKGRTIEKVADLDIRGLSRFYPWYAFTPEGDLLSPRDLGGTEIYSMDFEIP